MKRVVLVIVALLLAASVSAQVPPPPTAYEIQVYRSQDVATWTVFRAWPIALSAVTCGLPPTTTPPPTINPPLLEWLDLDPVTGAPNGKACQTPIAALVAALPVAQGYRLTLTALNPPAAPSARSLGTTPFDVPLASSAVRTGVGVR